MKDYPARTHSLMFDEFRSAPFGLTITNSCLCTDRSRSLGSIGLRIRQFQSGDDAAKSQLAELTQDEDDVMSGRSIYVHHHFSLAIYAQSLTELDRHVAHAQGMLAKAGVVAVRETVAIKPAFYAQLPGCARWRTRPALTKSINALQMAAKNNVPRSRYRGRWGAPVLILRTTSGTEYFFHFQVQGSAQIAAEDVGVCLMIGPPGTGKTTLLAALSLLALRVPEARVVVIDKDYGLSIMVRAAGGSYLVMRTGDPSGLAPLLALSNTPEDVRFLFGFFQGLILSDGKGPLSGEEEERLQRAVLRQMEMPPDLRSFAQILVMLGQRSKGGRECAAERLRKWCRGEALGWAFDNERDELRMDARIVGFDAGVVLKDELVCSPTLSYLFYRTSKLIDGKPIVLAVDEAWQADRVPAFREQNKDYVKTIRKNEGIVIFATQSGADALKNNENADTYRQIPTKIFFADDAAGAPDAAALLVNGFGLTRAEVLAISEVLPTQPHTFLLKRPGGSVLCRFDLSAMRDKVAVLSGRRATYELMNRIIARHGPEPESWVSHFERQAPLIADDPVNTGGQQREAAA